MVYTQGDEKPPSYITRSAMKTSDPETCNQAEFHLHVAGDAFFYVSFIDHWDWQENKFGRGHLEFHSHGRKRCLEACAETQLWNFYGFVYLYVFLLVNFFTDSIPRDSSPFFTAVWEDMFGSFFPSIQTSNKKQEMWPERKPINEGSKVQGVIQVPILGGSSHLLFSG